MSWMQVNDGEKCVTVGINEKELRLEVYEDESNLEHMPIEIDLEVEDARALASYLFALAEKLDSRSEE